MNLQVFEMHNKLKKQLQNKRFMCNNNDNINKNNNNSNNINNNNSNNINNNNSNNINNNNSNNMNSNNNNIKKNNNNRTNIIVKIISQKYPHLVSPYRFYPALKSLQALEHTYLPQVVSTH